MICLTSECVIRAVLPGKVIFITAAETELVTSHDNWA